jgi:hypothetical protein
MKKISLLTIMLVLIVGNIFSQNTEVAKKEIIMEEKVAIKAKKEADMAAAFKEVELTEDQITKYKEIQADANKKNKELAENTKLNDVEKEAAKKAISDIKNVQIKELLGTEKYKQFNSIRKKQKEAAEATANKTN